MLADLIKEYIAPLLKQYGFKKKDLTWNKSKDGVVQVVDFQLSRFSNNEEEDFTINLGVFNPHVWEKCWGREPPKFIKEEDCFPRIRISQILNKSPKEATDHWWTYSASSDDCELGKKIVDLLEKECLPFFDGMSNQMEVVNFYSSNTERLMPIEKIYLAIIKNSVGSTQSSDELLSEVEDISKAWAARVDWVRSRLS